MPFMSAFAATGAAGFAAAQGIFDTALSAQAKISARFSQELFSRLQVTMGKLHIGLGFVTYPLGFAAALVSFNAYQKQWSQAVLRGNRGAQKWCPDRNGRIGRFGRH